jgi:hypothetical protein
VKALPGVSAEIKAMKTKNTLARKGLLAYKKKLKEKKVEFDELVEPQLEAIKLAKANATSQLNETEEFKTFRRLTSSLKLIQGKFQKKHNLTMSEMRQMTGNQYYGRRWGPWTQPMYLLKRAFRIRL